MSPKFSESKFHSAKSQNTMLITILFFFIIVFLQFSIKFYFSGWLVLITNSKLVIYVGKRRGFSRRLWLLIKELLIARDADRRNKTPYINVSFLEFDFLESHIFLEMFILTDKNHRLLDNPHSHHCGFRVVRKKKKYHIPDAASERV